MSASLSPSVSAAVSTPPPEFELERVARLACALFDVPLAALLLPPGTVRAHATRAGFPAAEAALLLAGCVAAAGGAAAPPFHVAAPLVPAEGAARGVLCLADSAPRVFDAASMALLEDLAALAARTCAAKAPEPELQLSPLLPLLDAMEDGVVLLDSERRVSWANRRAAALLGSDAGAVRGRRAQDFVVDAVAGMAEEGPPGSIVTREMTGRRADGSNVSLEVAACVIDSGGTRSYAAVVRDAAGRHELAWRARAASERRHKTFSMASHELRTPLASIIGFTELLLKREFDAATARELLEIVHTQAGLMSTLVNGVLDLARIEAGGRQALRVAPTAIDSVLVQSVANLEALGASARVLLDLAPDLPPVAGDTHRLQMAFTQVVSNALRYSSAASPVAVRAWLDPAPGARALLVRVADSGAGMTPDERERLFEPFHRGAAGRAAGDGLGLGMAIFKEIVDVHNGGVTVESTLGAGTVVTVRLPLAAGDADA